MRYRELAPPPPLAGFVEAIWLLDDPPSCSDGATPSEAPRDPRPIYPDGRLELVLNLGSPTLELPPGGAPRVQARALLVGQMERPVTVSAGPELSLVGVRFRPEGAAAFLDPPLAELLDRVTPLDDLTGAWGRELLERLAGQPSLEPAARLVEAALLLRLRPERAAPPAVREAVAVIAATRGRVPVDAVARRAGLSPRELQRGFARWVGLPPKRFSRVLRFQEVLAAAGSEGWAETAVRCGYYDQAHLIRDFRELAGAVPTRVLLELDGLSEAFARRVSRSSKTAAAPRATLPAMEVR